MEAGGTVHTKAGRGALFICISFVFSFCKTGGEVLAAVSRQGAPTTSSNPWQPVSWQVQTLPGIQWHAARGANLRRSATLASALAVGAAGVAAVEGKGGMARGDWLAGRKSGMAGGGWLALNSGLAGGGWHTAIGTNSGARGVSLKAGLDWVGTRLITAGAGTSRM